MAHSTEKKSKYRTHLGWRYYDQINKRTCLHIDAWLRETADGVLYFVMEARVGGHMLCAQSTYRAEPGVLIPVDVCDYSDCVARHVDSPWAGRHAPWLADLHSRIIRPTLYLPRAGFLTRSIRLHYIYTDASVNDPMAGIVNTYNETRRGVLNPLARDPADTYVAEVAPAKLQPRERSVLRTLDKLLKG